MFDKIYTPDNSTENTKIKILSELRNVLSSSISPVNIYSFYNEAVDKLVNIVALAVNAYKKENPNTNLSGKELEDASLIYLGSSDVGSILDAISERRMSMRTIEQNIADRTDLSLEVFVPPKQNEEHIIAGSGKGLEEKKLIPRLLTLIYILENDLNIYLENSESEEAAENNIDIAKGEVTDNMMRKYPYYRILIPELNRVVYICEEEGNATFVFNHHEIENIGMKIEDMDTMDKREYGVLIESNTGLGVRIIQTNSWREEILAALTADILRVERKVDTTHEVSSDKKVRSDFTNIEDTPKKRDGWESANSLIKICKSATASIRKYADIFRELNPKWFQIQNTDGRRSEHYSPELVGKIIEHFNETPQKKEGWESANSLIKICKSAATSIRKYADIFRELNPEWFEMQTTGSNKSEHYSPELVANIVKYFNQTLLKRSGWESASSLIKICKVGYRAIKEYADTFRELNKEWFEVQKNVSRTAEHYSPELVEKIKEYFSTDRNLTK